MNKRLLFITSLFIVTSLYSSEYSFRKYTHVKEFYKGITKDVIKISTKYNLPPAAILAIAGLESGYGSGYVSQITGNILSLGAFRSDKELPSLYLPYSDSKKSVIFDPAEIQKHSNNDLSWKQRPKSLKRDYRPTPYAGTTQNLELLIYNKELKHKANNACLNDFATRWIKVDSNIKAFSQTRIWLDNLINPKNSNILFNMKTNREFIYMIGGKKLSFNYRETWPKKVELIMKKVGLVKLTNDIHYKNMSFEEAWSDL